jgi:dGTPase
MLRWKKLLNSKRFTGTIKDPEDLRSEFERDHDRIIYSSAFRRLQDKAQVFPLERQDFVRTRLTHSLEVSTLARSLGADIARKLIIERKLPNNQKYDDHFGSILSSIALIHDLGNPPFGHFGEKAIGNWFADYFDNNHCELKQEEAKEYTNFEGNAQTFRIVSRLQVLKHEYGLNLTFATLSSLFKYPRASHEVDKEKGASFKKYGYFQSEKDRFDQIVEETGLNGLRHPLAFLLEAADDIAYSAGDVEDGFKKGVLSWEELIAILDKELEKEYKCLHKKLLDTEKKLKKENRPEPRYNSVQDFRIAAQGKMFRKSAEIFVKNVYKIMEGAFDKRLIEVSDAANLFVVLRKKLGEEKVYISEEVLRQEIVSNRVINGLLKMLVHSLLSDSYEDPKKHEGKLYRLISPNFRHIFEATERTQYDRLRLVTDYISGMTDSYALELYQKFWGYRV